jgi:hypothetical protein
MNTFYVYEHWRPDKDVCFYVGKGRGNRAYNFRRRLLYNRVVRKLAVIGMCVEVRMVASGLSEQDAFAIECHRIAFWRSVGSDLTNVTDGGEGRSGSSPSVETRAKISASHTGRKNTVETIEKMKLSAKKRAESTVRIENLVARNKRGPSQETRDKIRLTLTGRTIPAEVAKKISASLKGRTRSAEHSARISAALRARRFEPA